MEIVEVSLWIFFLCSSRVCRFVLYTLLFMKIRAVQGPKTALNYMAM